MVTVDTDLNIIMPWANMDLEDFLIGGYQSMKSTEYFLLDLIYEAGELAAALEFLHDGLQARCERPELQHQAIRHADFKPQNILVFQRGGSSTGIWRVADFGVSQVARRNMSRNRGYESGRSTAVNLNPPPRGGIYEAPDSNAQRRSDIWSFGCILARIFALGLGPGCLPEFDAIRVRPVDGRTVEDRFYGGSPPILNPNVKTWIEDLPKRFHDSHNVELLNGMRDLLFQMLVIDFRDRLSAYQVRSRLHKLCHLPIEPEPEPMPPYRGPAIMPVIPPTPPTTPRSSSHRSNSSRVSQETILTTRNVDHSPDKLEVGVLVNSIRSGSVDNVKQCLRRRPDVEDCHDGDRPLIYAIEKSSVPMIRALWDHKQDLDAKSVSSEGETPLNLAVLKGDVEMVKILIDILVHNDPKASLDKLSGKGKTPLMEAASRGYVAVVSELLNRGADPTICAGENQLNSLHHAVDNIAAKENLLEAFLGKMDFDQSPPGIKYYETPMMRHITHGISGYYGAPKARPLWKKKFDVLLKGGADVNRSYPEKRPLLCAMSKNHVQIAEVLLLADAFLPHGEKGTSHQMRQMIRRVRKSKGSF
jgi:serine/threonine protein kinase